MLHDFVLTLFQFHEGPIKTIAKLYPRSLVSSFNSMKVRLKQLDQLVKQGELTGFNSMKVRLKQVDNSFTDLRVIRFQFHEGPIKTLKNPKKRV